MMRLLILFLFSFVTLSCDNNEYDLRGHWHIYQVNKEDASSFGDYSTIDIINDTLAIFDAHNLEGINFEGHISKKDSTILFGGECLILNFRYQFENGKLFLNQKEYDNTRDITFIGEKCDSLCCDKQKEYFKNFVISIDLPNTSEGHDKIFNTIHLGLMNSVFIGPLKNRFKFLRKEENIISLNGYSLGLEDIEMWRKKCLIKLPSNKRSLSGIVIYVDKFSPDYLVDSLLSKLHDLDINRIYKAYRKDDDFFSVEYELLQTSK